MAGINKEHSSGMPKSFRKDSLSGALRDEAVAREHESMLIYRQKIMLKGQLSDYTKILAEPSHTINAARSLAGVEASTLALWFPQLVEYPNVLPTYRLVRVAELMGIVTRGVPTLHLGSAATVFEALAARVLPPPAKKIGELFANAQAETILLNNPLPTNLNIEPIPMAQPLATGVDYELADIGFKTSVEETLEKFGVKNVNLVGMLIRDALETEGLLPIDGYKLLMMHRVDPNMLYKERSQEIDTGLIAQILQRLQPEGSIVITIGRGDNEQERQKRFLLLKSLRFILLTLGIKLDTQYFQSSFTDPNDKMLFGDGPGGYYGIGGVIIGKK